MLSKLFEIISKFRSGDIRGAFKLILEVVLDNIDQIQLPLVATAKGASAHSSKSEAELIDELDGLCCMANFTAQAGWFDKIRPILMELLRRWLGF